MLFLPMIIAAFITFIATPFVIRLAYFFGFVDDPKTRFHPAHTHTGVIPRAGGLALLVGFFISAFFFIPFTKAIAGLLISCCLLVAVGLGDDRRDIHPYIRFITNMIAAGIVVAAGAGIPFVTNPINGGIVHLDTWRITIHVMGTHSLLVWADLFAFFWILWTMNIVGWSAGVEGQMPGFTAIAAFILALLALRYTIQDPSQLIVATLALIVSGTFLGFLPWNFYPQKIMPGYGGKTLAGFLLAVVSIFSYGKLGTALLVLGIPMVDALYTLIRRIGHGKSPVWADRGHLQHKLLDLGWGKRRIALFYWGVSAILGVIALSVTSQQKLFTFLLLVVGIGGFFVWVNFFTYLSKPQDPDNG